MKQTIHNKLVSEINSKLEILRELGTPITNELISEKIDEIANAYSAVPNFELTEQDVKNLKFHIGNLFNVLVGEAAISLRNPDLPLWFDSKKTEIKWRHWDAYKEMLGAKGRSGEILDANERVIDDILDYSGDPTTPGPWSRKGLVMGNVQSGKTQNYIGLINKAIDCGYKTIILLGGHLNDLRRQTQERVDEGVLGRESRHLAELKSEIPSPIGVGLYRENNINTGTTTLGDFNKTFAGKLGFKLTGEDPVIFTIKKHTGVMTRLHKWIKEYHYLNPEIGKKLPGPLLLVDDEADYASINTKHHKEEVTKTNEYIRELLKLFDRNTYIGYTATPFANIFIDPDESTYSDNDDLFPSDFMIKMPVPDNYLGQDFYFGQQEEKELEGGEPDSSGSPPTVAIEDYMPIYELKGYQEITAIPESLKEAVRAFVIAIAVRAFRGEESAHNTMLVNISHLSVHQNQLERLIEQYYREIDEALAAYSGLGVEQARQSDVLKKVEETFYTIFTVEESYEQIFDGFRKASGRVKIWAINQSTGGSGGRDLDYQKHEEYGLCAVVIGGHKLSRGLTLEGLSISYFARNSKAYDTLMQMCRWFGYRPGYDDLCKVFLPNNSITWYTFIASAIRELYQELELMSRRGERPKDFGLKVREHPGAMIITAKNKIGWSDTTVRSQDLWGQIQRRFRFKPDPEINMRNLEYVREFVGELERSGVENSKDKDSGAWVFKNVEYASLIDFISSVDLPEDDVGNYALINHLKKMEAAALEKPRVVVYNQPDSRPVVWSDNLKGEEKTFFDEKKFKLLPSYSVTLARRRMIEDTSNGFYKVNSVHLGNPDDEKLFLDDEARADVVAGTVNEKPVSFEYVCSQEIDCPGLLRYLFAIGVGPQGPIGKMSDQDKAKFRLGHGPKPTIGYTVSLPRPSSLKGKSREEVAGIIKDTKQVYAVGKVYSRLQQLSAYEEHEDDE